MLTCARNELQAGIIFRMSFLISHFSSSKALKEELLPAHSDHFLFVIFHFPFVIVGQNLRLQHS
jgi:hypothetical protein